jgi:hypothetical protein
MSAAGGLLGDADSKRGSDGNNNGSMYLESNSSPKACGALAGSHADFSCVLSNSMSMLYCATDVSEEEMVDIEGAGPAVAKGSFREDETLS